MKSASDYALMAEQLTAAAEDRQSTDVAHIRARVVEEAKVMATLSLAAAQIEAAQILAGAK